MQPVVGERCEGRVRTVKDQGFGFITMHFGADIFYHQNEVLGNVVLGVGDEVSFEVADNPLRKQRKAVSVTLMSFGGRGGARQITAASGSSQKKYTQADYLSHCGLEGRLIGLVSYISEHQKYGFLKQGSQEVEKCFFWLRDVNWPAFHGQQGGLKVGDKVHFQLTREDVVGPTGKDIRPLTEKGYQVVDSTAFTCGRKFHAEEDRETEFKSLDKSGAPDRTIPHNCNKYLNAFLNSSGGTLYFGIFDDGIVNGIQLNRNQRDLVRRGVDEVLNRHSPSVPEELYSIVFHQVYVEVLHGVLPVPDRSVVAVRVAKGTAPYYANMEREAYARRDGSVHKMTPDVIAERVKQDMLSQQPDFRSLIKEHLDSYQLELASRQKRKAPATGKAEPPLPGEEDVVSRDDAVQEEMTFNDGVISNLVAMGFERAEVLDSLYVLNKEGAGDADFNLVLDRLSNTASCKIMTLKGSLEPFALPSPLSSPSSSPDHSHENAASKRQIDFGGTSSSSSSGSSSSDSSSSSIGGSSSSGSSSSSSSSGSSSSSSSSSRSSSSSSSSGSSSGSDDGVTESSATILFEPGQRDQQQPEEDEEKEKRQKEERQQGERQEQQQQQQQERQRQQKEDETRRQELENEEVSQRQQQQEAEAEREYHRTLQQAQEQQDRDALQRQQLKEEQQERERQQQQQQVREREKADELRQQQQQREREQELEWQRQQQQQQIAEVGEAEEEEEGEHKDEDEVGPAGMQMQGPASEAGSEQEMVFPCEFCHEPFAFDQLDLHQRQCLSEMRDLESLALMDFEAFPEN